MICVTCNSDISASMHHAISMNSCPFCGRSIFSSEEFEFRKTVQRILIKNGLEDEEVMAGIVDDVTTALSEQITRDTHPIKEEEPRIARRGPVSKPGKEVQEEKAPVKPQPRPQARPRVASQQEMEEAMAAEEDPNDPEAAPTRALTSDPARTNRGPRQLTKADQMAIAMQEWQKAQKIDDDDDRGGYQEEVVDPSEFFTSEELGTDITKSADVAKAQRLQAQAAEERMRQIQAKSGFKNQPIQRRPN